LIQDDHRTRKFDSRSHRSRFDCCAPAPHRRLFQQHRSDAVIRRCPRNVRFAPGSRRRADIDGRQVRARRRP